MGLAHNMYLDDYDGTFAPNVGFRVLGEVEDGKVGWADWLKSYNKALKAYTCPSDHHTYSYSRNWKEGGYDGQPKSVSDIQDPTKFLDFFEVPGSGIKSAQFAGKNAGTGDADLDNAGQEDGNVYNGGRKMSSVPIGEYADPDGSRVGQTRWHWLYWPGRHNKANSLLFLDGHVKSFQDWDPNNMTFDPDKNWSSTKK